MEGEETPSILLPAAYDVVWSVVTVVVIVVIVIALVVLVRFARAGRRARAASAALDEARLELVRERTARLRAGLPDAPGASVGDGDPTA
jgi:type II secretory pathway pseudopilin PulG